MDLSPKNNINSSQSDIKYSFHTPKKAAQQKFIVTPNTDDKSPENMRISSFQLLSSHNPWSPTLQSLDNSRINITDRYIPARKLFSQESLFLHALNSGQTENVNHNTDSNRAIRTNDCIDEEISTKQYQRFLRNHCSNNQCKNSEMQEEDSLTFRNSNFLKYSQHLSSFQQNQLITIRSNPLLPSNGFENESVKIKKHNINKVPFKVLDAPGLQDDYYLNLLEWSDYCNIVAVGLANKVYLWDAQKQAVTKLAEFQGTASHQLVCSVSWSKNSSHLAIGSSTGRVEIYDVEKNKIIKKFQNHSERVSSLSWNNQYLLTSGSRDKSIIHCDIRTNNQYFSKQVLAHKQQVCGLKWSQESQKLASGGNDNKLLIWDINNLNSPILKYSDHRAAVKALAWSPYQYGLIISGGGTADKTIRFRNTTTGQTTKILETGSQVCNLMFSKTIKNQFVSTHGYSENQIAIWKYPKLQKVYSLKNHHSARVLYLTMSPDGGNIVTGAGDETLRFWKLFPTISEVSEEQNCQKSGLLEMKQIFLR